MVPIEELPHYRVTLGPQLRRTMDEGILPSRRRWQRRSSAA